MEMLFQAHMFPFTVALLIVLGIGLLEILGLGLTTIDLHLPDHDLSGATPDHDWDFLSWLGVGKVPLMVVLICALTIFGLSGLVIQNGSNAFLGGERHLPVWMAVLCALGATIVLLPITASVLARVMPRDETTAISLDELVWSRASVVQGNARRDLPARARVRDRYGDVHHVSVIPELESDVIPEGEEVRLLRREGDLFVAQRLESDLRAL